MKLVYVAGPYRGDIDANIEHAREAAQRLWALGYAVVTPHLNTAHFDGLIPDEEFLAGDLEILKRCDAIYMLNGWRKSQGAKAEHAIARDLKLEIMYE